MQGSPAVAAQSMKLTKAGVVGPSTTAPRGIRIEHEAGMLRHAARNYRVTVPPCLTVPCPSFADSQDIARVQTVRDVI